MVTIAKTKQPVRMPRFGHRVDKTDPIMRGCVGWWPLNDGAGTKAVDLSGNGNDGTQSGGVAWASTAKGTAASFDGVNDYFNIGTAFWNDNIVGGSDFSINAWFYVDDASLDRGVIGSWGGGESNLIMWVDFGGSAVSLTCIGTDSGFGITSVDAPIVNTAQWYMGTLVANNTAGTATVYLNGTSDNSVSYTASLSTIAIPFGIGSQRGNAVERIMDGNIQNVRVYNRALSASEVSRLYSEPWAGLEPLSPFSFFSVPTAGAPLAVFYNHYKNQGII